MKNSIVIILLIKASTIFGQSENWEVYVSKVFLPSPQYEREIIQCNNSKITYLVKTSKKKERSFNTRQNSSFDSIEIVLNNIKLRIQDTVFYLPIQLINRDSINLNFLESMNLVTDSTIIFNSRLYERKMNQPVKSEMGNFFVPKLTVRQIDGERMIFRLIMNEDTLINLNVGESEDFSFSDFKNVLFLVELFYSHGYFKKIGIDSYISKERLTFETQKYIEALMK